MLISVVLVFPMVLWAGDTLTQWLGIYLSGNKIGYVYRCVYPEDGGVRIIEKNYMSLSMLGENKQVSTFLEAAAGHDLKLHRFTFNLKTGDQLIREEGTVEGKELNIKLVTGSGSVSHRNFDVPRGVYLPSLLEVKVALKGISNGLYYVFDPSTVSLDSGKVRELGTQEVEWHGRRVKAKLYESTSSGIRTKIWVYDGRIVREESPMQIVMIDMPASEATQMGTEPIDLLSLFAVKPGGLNVNPSGKRHVELKLSGPNLENLDLNFAGQRIIDRGKDYVIVAVDRIDMNSLKDTDVIPDSMDKYLLPTSFIQSDAPEIRDLARSITEGEESDVGKVRKILNWVYYGLEKKPTVTLPTALDVLKMGYGDCNEHSILFAALARAAGIPTEITVGLIYQMGSYYYHAWDAVYVGGHWVFVDPILGEFPASCGHLMLKRGEIEKQAELVPVVGQLKIEIVRAE